MTNATTNATSDAYNPNKEYALTAKDFNKLFKINRVRFLELLLKYSDALYVKTDLLIELADINIAQLQNDTEFLKRSIYIFENGTETAQGRIDYRLSQNQKILDIVPISELIKP